MDMQLYFLEVIRLLAAFIMLVAAWGKCQAFALFQTNLIESFRVPASLSKAMTLGIIAMELLLAIFILANNHLTDTAMWMTLAAFIIFTLAVIVRFSQNELVKCNCFGAENRPVSALDIVRNLLMMALLIYYLLFSSAAALVMEAQTLCALLAAIFCICMVNFHDIAMSFNKNWV